MSYSVILGLKPLSRGLHEIANHYDAIVVGSGYGGSIAASRLARAGRRVAVLERGRELLPGQYPETLAAARSHMQLTGRRRTVGDRRGLYWFHTDGDVTVFGGCGLGGGSLVNAAVALEPDRRVFDDPVWPTALRKDMGGLDEGFARASEMLRPEPFPTGLPAPVKTTSLRLAAVEDRDFSYTPVNVTFHRTLNAVGVEQEPCNSCGNCITGCNVGAKNTLLMNYLPDAVAHGAQIFTEIEARWVEKRAGGWVVMAVPTGPGRQRFHAEPMPIRADMVVLAAGTLGSTAVLLRSSRRGLPLSNQLGERFSGNGDILGYWLLGRRVGAVGSDGVAAAAGAAGPCISGMLDDRSRSALDDGTVIEDAVIPAAIAPLVPELLLPEVLATWFGRWVRGAGPLAWAASTLSSGRRGLLQRLQTVLVMGHDSASGRIALDGHEEPYVDWPSAGTGAYYRAANARLMNMARTGGGRFLPDPIWTRLMGYKLVTVHPLGGCPMADDAERGVVDDQGRVFDGSAGRSVHEGLFVWDGSIVPRSLGVNPLLTISGLAERAAALAVGRQASAVGTAPREKSGPGPSSPPVEPPGPEAVPKLTFSEKMTGWWSTDTAGPPENDEDFREAAGRGESTGTAMSFVLTMTAADARRVVADLASPMAVVGTVDAPALSPEPLLVAGGTFRCLVADQTAEPSLTHMRYDLPLQAVDGRCFHMTGRKSVRPGSALNLWPDTTTMYVTVTEGDDQGGLIGAGVLRIEAADFARLLRTMTVSGPMPAAERLGHLARFGRAFAGALWDDYGSAVHHTVAAVKPAQPRSHRPLDVPPRQVIPYTTGDGLTLRLTRYHGGRRGPVVLVHGMGANPLTYLLDTIAPNTVEYLVAHGFDVWLQEWRGSTMLETCRSDFDADQVARFDHPAAEQVVRSETGRSDIHWVTHCVGSITWVMATLSAAVRPASLFCSQVAAHPIGPWTTRLKAGIRAPNILGALGVNGLTTDAFDDEARPSRLFDQVLRLYPVPRTEQCQHAVCRRLAFIYGVAAHRDALDEVTHAHLHELFGPTNMRMMAHLARCARAEQLVTADGRDSYMPEVGRMALPITMIHGIHNLVWLPESTARSEDWLHSGVGSGHCRRKVIPGHGHQDCFIGATAWRDVLPELLTHLEWAGA